MKVSEAFESGIIPISYKNVVPLKCKCGSDLEVSDTLTRMWCPSNKCEWKQVARINKMLTSFGVKDVGEVYCSSLWKSMKNHNLSDSHVNIFNLPFSWYPATYSLEVTLKKFNNIQSVVRNNNFGNGMYFGTLVSNLALPELDINARKLFKGFSNIREFVEVTKRDYDSSYKYICSIFGDGVQSRKIYNTIKEFCYDIQIAERIFRIKKAVNSEIKVSITGRIKNAGKYTRVAYLEKCNEICDGVAEIIDVNPGPSILCVVADEPSNSATYGYGLSHNNLITSDEFIRFLKEKVI